MPIIGRQLHGNAQGTASGNDRYFVDGIGPRQSTVPDTMSVLEVCLLLLAAFAALLAHLAHEFRAELDLTQTHRNTLSPATLDVLKRMEGREGTRSKLYEKLAEVYPEAKKKPTLLGIEWKISVE